MNTDANSVGDACEKVGYLAQGTYYAEMFGFIWSIRGVRWVDQSLDFEQ